MPEIAVTKAYSQEVTRKIYERWVNHFSCYEEAFESSGIVSCVSDRDEVRKSINCSISPLSAFCEKSKWRLRFSLFSITLNGYLFAQIIAMSGCSRKPMQCVVTTTNSLWRHDYYLIG